MSVYINVEKTNLIIKRENFKNIIYAFRNLAENNKYFEECRDVKSIREILDFIGIPYEYDELEDYYVIEECSDDFYEIYDFEVALKTIAENLQENENYELIINCSEYGEKTKYIFKNNKLIRYSQNKEWKQDNIEEVEEVKQEKKLDKDIEELEGFKQREYLKSLEQKSDLTDYEKMNGYLD